MENKCACLDPNGDEKGWNEAYSRQTLPPAFSRLEGVPFKHALREQQHKACLCSVSPGAVTHINAVTQQPASEKNSYCSF